VDACVKRGLIVRGEGLTAWATFCRDRPAPDDIVANHADASEGGRYSVRRGIGKSEDKSPGEDMLTRFTHRCRYSSQADNNGRPKERAGMESRRLGTKPDLSSFRANDRQALVHE
jgi:hypothetical protein